MLTLITYSKRLKTVVLALLVAALGWIVFQESPFASAVTDTAISNTAPVIGSSSINGTTTNKTPFYGVGTGHFNGKNSWLKVYVPIGDTTTITIHEACELDVGSPRVTYEMEDLDDGSRSTKTPKTEGYDGLFGRTTYYDAKDGHLPQQPAQTCGTDINFKLIGTTHGISSTIPGHTDYRVFYLYTSMNASVPSTLDNERYFKVESSNTRVRIGATLGVFANRNITSDTTASFFGVYQGDISSSDTWDYEVQFAKSCGTGTTDTASYIRLYDADRDVYNPQNLGLQLQRRLRGTNDAFQTFGTPWTNNNFLPGSHQYDRYDFTANRKYEYKLKVTGLNRVNTLQIRLPFDQIDAITRVAGSSNCDPPVNAPTGSLNVTCKNYSLSGVSNQDQVAGQNNYRILRGTTSVVNGIVTGSSVPTTAHTFTSGTTYTLQILYNSGSWKTVDTSVATDAPGGCTPPLITTQCSMVSVHDFGPQPTPSTPPSTGTWAVRNTGEWRSNTEVNIKDSRGNTFVNTTLGNDASNTWNYTPMGEQLIITINRKEHVQRSDGAYEWVTYSTVGSATYTCYKPRCDFYVTADSNPPGVPSDKIIEGLPYSVHGKLYNDVTYYSNGLVNDQQIDIPLKGSLNGIDYPVSLTVNGQPHDIPQSVPVGGYVDVDVAGGIATADASGNISVTAYPDFYGRNSIVPPPTVGACTKPFPVYKQFNISISASTTMVGGTESPTSVDYKATVNNSTTPTVYVVTNSTFTKQGVVQVSNSGGTYPSGATDTLNGSYPPGSISPGTQYCTTIHADYTTGYVNLSNPNDILNPSSPQDPPPDCQTVNNKPYVHVFGGDVSAGGGFGTNCTTTPGSIKTYLRTVGTVPVGSGVQIGALAIGPITGFSSAILRGSPPTGSSGLSFANSPLTPDSSTNSPATGGNLGGSNCVTDYFGQVADSVSRGPSPAAGASLQYNNPSGDPLADTRYYTGDLKLNNATIGDGVNITMYVDGDLAIKDNIAYKNTAWGIPEKIPSVRIVVKGNIYIDSNVTQLDGLYVAQPKADGTKGSIYTCATDMTGFTAYNADLLATCNKQLVINGAFVSQHTYLSRAFGSLRDSSPGERIQNVSKSCVGSGVTTKNDCAAEVFNFSPELYMVQTSGESPYRGPTTFKYDSITSLSPIL